MYSTPDGMGADRHRERQNMKRASRDPAPAFTHDVVAVDGDGEVVFETEALYPNEVDDALDDYPEGDDAPEGVDHYEVRERDE